MFKGHTTMNKLNRQSSESQLSNNDVSLGGAADGNIGDTDYERKQSKKKIKSLRQDLYLTDLKNDVGELESELTTEKEKNLVLTQQLAKAKKDIANLRKTIASYRKAATDMQKDFFTGGRGGGPPSSVTVTSAVPGGSLKADNS